MKRQNGKKKKMMKILVEKYMDDSIDEKEFETMLQACKESNAKKRTHRNRMNLVGQKFGKLTVISEAKSRNNNRRWVCKCDCGNEVMVWQYGLTSGKKQNCGCKGKLICDHPLKPDWKKVDENLDSENGIEAKSKLMDDDLESTNDMDNWEVAK